MGWTQKFTCRQTLGCLTISLLILMISSLSQLTFQAEGRKLLDTHRHGDSQIESEKRAMFRSQIGSRPPRCDKRCASCGHCEAIQVPTNPQITSGNKKHTVNSNNKSKASNSIAYARDSDNSNYKPMSWKCKCGNLIFNP